MKTEIDQIKKNIESFYIKTHQDVEKFRIEFIGKKKGIIPFLLKKLKYLSIENRKIYGQILNDLKVQVNKKIQSFDFKKKSSYYTHQCKKSFDTTIPGKYSEIGSLHPLSILKNRMIDIFSNIGYSYVDGFEIEDDWHNFTALNIPFDHPSRDMHDTFFLCENKNVLMRTHTSSVQIRYMKQNKPPLKILSIGKVYRNETISSRSNFMFHQAEGFYIDKKVSFSDLKKTIHYMIDSILGNIKIRFRPSYFPFTEPSAEIDIFYNNEWLEIMGCGMIDPEVLNNVHINSEMYSGFAFGIGLERLALIIYNIKDLRIYFDNDIRFLSQFRSELY
ncbi:phenylalanine--tRNA ligase subunit alpha [Blattabacterium cuenoti]|uniref:phenylalanine--tRNA ligase subunit alpha n=1 Tax=Blattabacterium cuenoti TaxID=1653831 RepID=UPI00163C0366|nr:phenylalanine--tRNA ligase subunit alpha [Blattabacterium cuenoti]